MNLNLTKDEASLTLELPYQNLTNGIMWLRDGSAEVGFEVKPFDTSLYSQSEMLVLHKRLMRILREGTGVKERLRIYYLPMRAKPRLIERFQELLTSDCAISKALNEERATAIRDAQENEELVEYRMFVTTTVTLGRKRRNAFSRTQAELTSHTERVQDAQEALYRQLKETGYQPTPLLDSGVMELIYTYFNPGLEIDAKHEYTEQKVFLANKVLKMQPSIAPSTVRDQALSCDIKRGWNTLRIDDQYIKGVFVKGPLADEVETGMVSRILNVKGCRKFVFCIDFVHADYEKKMQSLQTEGRKLYVSANPQGGPSDYGDPKMREGAAAMDESLIHLSRTNEHVFSCGMTMWLIDEDKKRLKAGVKETLNNIRAISGLKPYVLSAGLKTQFQRLAPFSGEPSNLLWDQVESDAATLVVATGSYQGSGRPRILLENRHDGLTVVDPFNPKLPNANAIVGGGTGAGKSFQVMTILGQLLASDNLDVMITDQKQDYKDFVRAHNGAVIPFGPGSGVQINPFDLTKGQTRPDSVKKAFLKALIRTMIPYSGADIATEDNLIMGAIDVAYARATSYDTIDDEDIVTFDGVLLSDYRDTLSSLEEVGGDRLSTRQREIAGNLASQLAQWTGDSPYGELFDRPTNVELEARVVYFDASALKNYKDLNDPAMLVMTDMIWQRIKRDISRYKIVVVEELAATLRNPAAASFIKDLYALARFYKTGIWSVTQSLEDYRSEEAKSIIGNTSIYLLMQLNDEDQLVREILGLSERGLGAYADLRKVSGKYSELLLWLRKEDGFEGGIVINRPDPLLYRLITSKPEEREARTKLLEGATTGEEVVARLQSVYKKLAA